ncbi:MAG: endonuclease/exonuclease/phosphatase family protein [Thermoanaerobaculia bacterium]
MPDEAVKRRPILGLLALFALFMSYRIFVVYTIRVGECRPKPVDPSLRTATRNEGGQIVTFPDREGYPRQPKPLTILTYNIEGHDELYDGAHAAKIAETIRLLKPDIVGLQEVHRGTWQVRFRDQFGEIQRQTGLRGLFAPSYKSLGGEFGNAILTRGDILSTTIHPLPSVGEPRSVMESVVRIDGALLNVYVTHLTAWGSLKSKDRGEQLECLAKHVRTSRYPFILLGDFNAPPDYEEIARFSKLNTAQLVGRDIILTHPLMHRRIDYIFADYGWQIVNARAVPTGSSDHYPVIAQMFWSQT